MTKRIFVSIDLPQKTRDYLSSIARPDIYWIKWMKQGNFHITLNFLGDLTDAEISEATAVVDNVRVYHKPFTLPLVRLKLERDMLWVTAAITPELSALQEELQKEFRANRLGKKERRDYQPHVLLAKSKRGRNMEMVIENFVPQQFEVNKINLYESELTPGAATHKLIQSFDLG